MYTMFLVFLGIVFMVLVRIHIKDDMRQGVLSVQNYLVSTYRWLAVHAA